MLKSISLRKNFILPFIRKKLGRRHQLAEYLPRKPVSREFGLDRGLPIDRYYIEDFLKKNKNVILGKVLEIGDSTYTRKFGSSRVTRSLILDVSSSNGNADIIADLSDQTQVPKNLVDCFILTQTFPFIYEFKKALSNAVSAVKSRGHLLITVPGITQISRYDMDRWGHFWGFTDLSLRKILEESVPLRNINITVYGNVKAAACFLYGFASNELDKNDLDYKDRDYPITIAAMVLKP